MTNELEKQFFQCFGIEPKLVESCTKPRHKCSERFVKDCSECPRAWRKYPTITDYILLELIRIIGLITIKYTNEQCEICYGDGAISYLGKDLKEAILNFLISKVLIFKHQVRTLFEEG